MVDHPVSRPAEHYGAKVIDMKSWLFLAVAIIAEVVATSSLKASSGFTKFWPSVVVVLGYGVAFYFLSLTRKAIPVGIAYAVWAGLGIVLISVAGVAVINVFSKVGVH